MPGLLTPALCFGGGALLGVGLFVALNWEPICERFAEAMDEHRMYWEAIQEVRAKRQNAARRGDEDNYSEPDNEVEKATGLFLASQAGRASDSESEPEQELGRRKPFTEPQRSRSSSEDQSAPELFAVYTVAAASSSSSEEDVDEDTNQSDSNEFSSYDRLDGSDFSLLS